MDIMLLVSAIAGFGSAIGHSYLGERFILRPLLAARGDNRALAASSTRRLLRWVWHLPSFAWAQIAAVTLWLATAPAVLDHNGQDLLLYFGVGVYMTGAALNAWCMRGPHVGNLMLTVAALTLWFGVRGA